MRISNCCGADMGEAEDLMICPDCKEHCRIIEYEEEDGYAEHYADLKR